MNKNIESKVILDALKVARDNFYEQGKDMIDKISKYMETGTMSGYLGDPSFDYARFSKVMTGGFNSIPLQMVFESLVYLHYFNQVSECTIDPKDFIVRRKFDCEGFNLKVNTIVEIVRALEVLEIYVNRTLRNLGIKPKSCTKVLNSTQSILDTLKIMEYGMSVALHHYGDHTFLVSKIPISKEHPFNRELPLNPHIFYTDNPEQILSLAHQVSPGIYVIANVPYGDHAETAFYILFRQEGYAYLVENSKHSYRDQYYRTKSNGTPGKDAWLDQKYERCYLPVDIVMSFFNGESHETAVKLNDKIDFISLGKITDCGADVVLYTYTFIDKCYTFFQDNDFSSKISGTSCAGYIAKMLSGATEKVPAIASAMLPVITEQDMSWIPEISTDGCSKIFEGVEADLPAVVGVDLSELPQGSLTSVEHLKRSVIYRKRLQRATLLEKQWKEDFLVNHSKVRDTILSFVKKRGLDFLVQKSFKDLTYPLKVYRQFGSLSHPVNEEGYAYKDTTILSGYDIKSKDERNSYVRTHIVRGTEKYSTFHTSDDRSVVFSEDRLGNKFLCSCCVETVARYYYTLQFLDWEIFKAFFEIKDEELPDIPDQLKKYLNQTPSTYTGNSILNDVDPVALIRNPWFLDYVNKWSKTIQYSQQDNPVFFVVFHLCGKCRLSLSKRLGVSPIQAAVSSIKK